MLQEELLLVHLTVAVAVRLVDHLLQLWVPALANSRLRLVAYCKECRLFLSLEGQREAQGRIRPNLNCLLSRH